MDRSNFSSYLSDEGNGRIRDSLDLIKLIIKWISIIHSDKNRFKNLLRGKNETTKEFRIVDSG